MKKKTNLQIAQEKTEKSISQTNDKIDELGRKTNDLYISLQSINELFNSIRNVPEEFRVKFKKINTIRLNWKEQVEDIEIRYKKAEVKQAGKGAVGVSAGVTVAAMGPSVAMGIATTFGVASTGTAISSLSGAAATNAALAWLGGGTLATGGGGMSAGTAFLGLAGPVGLAIAGVSIVASGILLFRTKANKNKLENVFVHISNRDIKSYQLAIVEINERIERIINETKLLNDSIIQIKTFEKDYNKMTEEQQYELGSYYNLMESSTMLLVNPILGLQPKFNDKDFEMFVDIQKEPIKEQLKKNKNMIMSLTNLLYKIDLDDKEKKLLHKSLKSNKEFLKTIKMDKKEFRLGCLTTVQKALNFRYKNRRY